MKVIKGIVASALLGLSASITALAHAGKWVTICPNDIQGIAVRDTASGLVTFTDKTGCGGREIQIPKANSKHDRSFTLFTTAHTADQALFIWIDCGTQGLALAGQVNMYKPIASGCQP